MISVIIPVYNAEKYISDCLQSLLVQTYSDWEAIIVDDGSKDQSATILKSFAKKDQRFKVIVKQNEGVSRTRNRALDLCQGEYIFFLDADDYLMDKSCFSSLVSYMESKQLDFVRFEYVGVNTRNEVLFSNRNARLRKKYYHKKITVGNYCLNVAKGEYFLCMNLIKNSIVQRHNIRFVEESRMREDAIFLLTYLQFATCAMYVPDVFYAYRKHEGAATVGTEIDYSRDYSVLFDTLYSLFLQSSCADYQRAVSCYLSDVVLELRGTPFFREREARCEALPYHSLKYRVVKSLGYKDLAITVFNWIDKLIKKIWSLR